MSGTFFRACNEIVSPDPFIEDCVVCASAMMIVVKCTSVKV